MTDIITPITKLIIFVSIMYFCYKFSYALSPYNSDKPNAKYVTIKNTALAKLLISKSKRNAEYTDVNDQYKLTLHSLVFYIIQVILVIAAIVFQIIPEIPCEPFDFHFGRHAHLSLETLNQKIPFILTALLLIIETLYISIPAFIDKLKKKEEKIKISDIVFIVLPIFFFIYLLKNLI